MPRRAVLLLAALMLSPSWIWAETEPTLARFAAWAPPERMDEFAEVYERRIRPILEDRGLVSASESGRATPDSVFTRLFEAASPGALKEIGEALWKDPAWQLREELGSAFGRTFRDGGLRYHLSLYSTPALFDDNAPEVRGEGFWRIYDDRDGLPGGIRPPVQDAQGHLWFGTKMSASRFDGQRFVDVGEPYLDTDVETLGPQSIFPDRNGNLWFMDGRGVVRYDGITFTRFTTEDGLSSNRMRYMMEDRRGVLWFVPAEPDSVSRFDGARFETMSAIALCCSNGAPIVEDEQGRIWVGTWKGVMRFDGEEWRTFTTHDGLGDDVVLGLYADEDGVWVGTRQGVSLYDGETFTFFDESHGVATGWGYTFLRDAAGVLWVGSAEFTSADGGLSRFDGEGWRLLGPDDGVPEGPALPLMLVRRSVGLFPEQHRPLRRAGVGDLPRTRRGGRRHRGPPGVLVVRGAALQRPGVAALQSRARSRD